MVVIQCTVDSEPPAELVLSHNGKVLAASRELQSSAAGIGHIQVSRNALRLQVQDMTVGDDNTYIFQPSPPLTPHLPSKSPSLSAPLSKDVTTCCIFSPAG